MGNVINFLFVYYGPIEKLPLRDLTLNWQSEVFAKGAFQVERYFLVWTTFNLESFHQCYKKKSLVSSTRQRVKCR